MKIVIVGKTGTGARTLADALEKADGLKVLKSCTTRKPRSKDDMERYHFLTEKQADDVAVKHLYTEIGGTRYFCYPEEIEKADILVVDPDGVMDVTAMYPDESIYLVYCHVDPGNDTAVTKLEASIAELIETAGEPDETRKQIEDKRYYENQRFETLKEMLFTAEKTRDGRPGQRKIFVDERYHGKVIAVYDFANDFEHDTLQSAAMYIAAWARQFRNIETIVKQCIQLEVFNSPEPGRVLAVDNASGKNITRTIDEAVVSILNSPETFNHILRVWLTHHLDIKLMPQMPPEPVLQVN